MSAFQGSIQIITNRNVLIYLLKGTVFTLIISLIAVAVSLMIGSLLALLRNYGRGPAKILKVLATAYIEIFRNTPLLLWIFVCLIFVSAPSFMKRKMWGLSSVEAGLLYKGCVALIIYTAAVMAEIVRGGLNAVSKGQFEAAHSQGFSTVQTMTSIVLPQAFHHIVPTLLGQVITTIKDSSFLANIAVIELMARTRQVLSGAYNYNGLGQINVSDVFVLFGFAFLIYFIIDFMLSVIVRKRKQASLCNYNFQRVWIAGAAGCEENSRDSGHILYGQGYRRNDGPADGTPGIGDREPGGDSEKQIYLYEISAGDRSAAD